MNDNDDLENLRARDVERRQPEGADYARMLLLWLAPGARSGRVLAWSAILFAMSVGLFLGAIWLLRTGISDLFFVAIFVAGTGLTIFCIGTCWLLGGSVTTPARAMANFEDVHWVIIATLTLAYASAFGAILGHAINPQSEGPPATEEQRSPQSGRGSRSAG